MRCAQPLVGLGGKACPDDEKLIIAIQEKTSKGKKTAHIADCRSYVAAAANTAKGGGYENVARYGDTEIDFYNIGNIHFIRKSLDAVVVALTSKAEENAKDTKPGFVQDVAQSAWLSILSDILYCASKIATQLEEGIPVACHCSDGWDRTPQACALAQLLLDPFYRTVDGFATLVEKDFASFGHKFHERCLSNTQEWSPVVLQFLDCVFQLMNQFPRHFEFSSELLVLVADCAYSGLHGGFLFNTDRERYEGLVQVSEVNIGTMCGNMWSASRTRSTIRGSGRKTWIR